MGIDMSGDVPEGYVRIAGYEKWRPWCSKYIIHDGSAGRTCLNKGKYIYKGRPYCKTHNPPSVWARAKARAAKRING
jgi:hypothetical protein